MTTDTIFPHLFADPRGLDGGAAEAGRGRQDLDRRPGRPLYIPSFAKLRVIRRSNGRVITAPAQTRMTVRHLLATPRATAARSTTRPRSGETPRHRARPDDRAGHETKLARYPPAVRAGRALELRLPLRRDRPADQIASGAHRRLPAADHLPARSAWSTPASSCRRRNSTGWCRPFHAAQGKDITATLMPLADWTAHQAVPVERRRPGLDGGRL